MENAHFESLYPEDSRFREIEKIIGFIKKGQSCQLIGLPGTGKSNLLGMLSFNRNVRQKHLGEAQKWFHFVYINFSECKNRSLFDVNKIIFLSLADSLKEREMDKEHDRLHKIFKEHLALKDELVLFQGLKEAIDFLVIEKELTIVFLFDRFEEYITSISKEFFVNLRVLRNRAKYRFSAVFALNRPLDELLEPEIFSDYYEFLMENIVYVSLLDKLGLKFRLSYLEKITAKKVDPKIYSEVLELTAGHGKITRLCFEALLASSGQQLASSFKLSEFLLKQKTIHGALIEIYNSLLPQEQSILQNKELGIMNKGGSLSYLEDVGLIENNKIAIPLFKKYLENLRPANKNSNNKLRFDENSNSILKGEILISDKLTGAEFRLLKYLLLNKDRILDREEIINAVWKDTASVAGVTDQALDQLIFRLRKKIEEKPNQPAHLQTVKGRGFKFNS